MEKLRSLIPSSVLCIGDAKRGDIGNSAAMYAHGLFDDIGFDAVTVNPYMGSDSVLPFLEKSSRGAFVLALTSNTGAKDFQYLRSNKRPLYEHIVQKARAWNSKDNCGLVVGATKPAELRAIRRKADDMPILIPGIGAQGGDLRSAVKHGSTRNGDLAVINVGRTILYASVKADFQDAARAAARTMRDSINDLRNSNPA
jgi:orotidine-5'-phosphate decarboxylase